jgi:hypothetical protein
MVVGLLSLALAGSLGAVTIIPAQWTVAIEGGQGTQSETVAKETPRVKHIPTPEAVKGIYMSQCVAGTPSFRDSLITLIEETELNSVVIDIKDFTGRIAFPSDNPILAHSVSDECGARDMKAFVEKLHEKGIYVIGRITVFQDPYYTKLHPEQAVQSISRPGEPWKDYKGLSFIDVSSRPYWDYVVALSKEAYEVVGFDELNYDYVRYPSDGPMKDARYVNPNRAEALEIFFAYLHQEVDPIGVVMSADLFGMTTTNTDDLNIGQQLERTLPYFDYVMPMVYPSHYPKNFRDLGNPNNYPYEIIKISMGAAVERTIATSSVVRTLSGMPIASTTPQLYTKKAEPASKMRPWLQDFDYGKDYTPDDIRAQIRGANDVGLTSWVFWDAGNKYSSLRQVLAKSEVVGQ